MLEDFFNHLYIPFLQSIKRKFRFTIQNKRIDGIQRSDTQWHEASICMLCPRVGAKLSLVATRKIRLATVENSPRSPLSFPRTSGGGYGLKQESGLRPLRGRAVYGCDGLIVD